MNAIQYVEQYKKYKSIIHQFLAMLEKVTIITPVKAVCIIEDWLTTLLKTMRLALEAIDIE